MGNRQKGSGKATGWFRMYKEEGEQRVEFVRGELDGEIRVGVAEVERDRGGRGNSGSLGNGIWMGLHDVGYFRNDDYDKINMNEMKMMRMRVIYMYMRTVF